MRPSGLGGFVLALLALAALPGVERAEAAAQFQSDPVTTASEGEPYVYDIVATGVGNVTVTAPDGLPAWLTLTRVSSGRYVLSGTPSAGDSGTGIRLIARDSDNSLLCRLLPDLCLAEQLFDIEIAGNRPPEVVAPGIPDQSATQGQPFELEVAAHFVDPDDDPLTFTASGLPTSFGISAGGRISGMPTTADVLLSPFEVRVTANDGRGGEVIDEFALIVQATARADIVLDSISAQPRAALVEEPVEWRIRVRNAGPSASAAVELEVEFAGTPFTLTAHECAADTETRLRCALGSLGSGESATINIEGSAEQDGDVYVAAAARSTNDVPPDPELGNNAAAASASIALVLGTEVAQLLDGPPALAVAAGALDGDEFDDLAVATLAGEPLALYLNVEAPSSLHDDLLGPDDSRRGLSSGPLSVGEAALHHDVWLADLDEDGRLDVVAAAGAGFASGVYLNGGAGAYETFREIGPQADDSRAVAVADLTGDGRADVVLANVGPSVVYLNQGGGDFVAGATLDGGGGSSRDVLVERISGGTLPDIVLAGDDGPAYLYPNQGGGTFGQPVAIDPGPTSSVASGDFNGDGLPDLVFGRDAEGPSGLPSNPVYLNDGSGGFELAAELGAAATVDVVAADFTGNGAADLLFVNASGTHQLYVGDGSGGFTLHARQLVIPDAARAAAGRYGRDGRLGLALSSLEGVHVFFNDGSGALGLGVIERPVIELLGEPQIAIEVGTPYQDPGARAVDAAGEALEPEVDNPVDPAVVGTYTVTYRAMDSAGNAAVPAHRSVRVEVRAEARGGGGGALGLVLPLLLAGLLVARWDRRSGMKNRG